MADTVGSSILNFFNTPAGAEALTAVSAQATTTAKISVYAIMGVVTAWAARRIITDIVDASLKIKELEKAAGTSFLFDLVK